MGFELDRLVLLTTVWTTGGASGGGGEEEGRLRRLLLPLTVKCLVEEEEVEGGTERRAGTGEDGTEDNSDSDGSTRSGIGGAIANLRMHLFALE
jgi:hypothetical protein